MFRTGTFIWSIGPKIMAQMRNVIGPRVRLARKQATPRITQDDLCARLQVLGLRLERPAISKIETGYREVTDVEVLALAKALGVSAAWLLGESDDPNKVSTGSS